MRILLDVCVVFLQYLQQKLVLGVVDGLDDKPKVLREIEERARLPWGQQFVQLVLSSEGDKVVGRVDVEVHLSKFSKHPRRVIFKLEVVLSRGR